jgi:hypothetical protein
LLWASIEERLDGCIESMKSWDNAERGRPVLATRSKDAGPSVQMRPHNFMLSDKPLDVSGFCCSHMGDE